MRPLEPTLSLIPPTWDLDLKGGLGTASSPSSLGTDLHSALVGPSYFGSYFGS